MGQLVTVVDYALMTEELVKQLLGVGTVTEARTDQIRYAMNAAIDAIQRYIGGARILEATHTEYYDGTSDPEIVLAHTPVTACAELNIDSSRDFLTATEIDAGDYTLYQEAGIIRLTGLQAAFSAGAKNVKIVYTGGYAAAEVPWDVQAAYFRTIQNIYWVWFEKKRVGVQSLSGGAGVGSTSFKLETDLIPEDARAALDRLRDRFLAATSWTTLLD